jgi:Phage integrase family
VRESEKLKRRTIHTLRHSFASIHLMQGTSITEVSAMLGHSNVNITLTVYSHFIPKMRTDSTNVSQHPFFKLDTFWTLPRLRRVAQMAKWLELNAPGVTRTRGPRIRNPVLYPPELRGHSGEIRI